jgi:hypothetical protein
MNSIKTQNQLRLRDKEAIEINDEDQEFLVYKQLRNLGRVWGEHTRSHIFSAQLPFAHIRERYWILTDENGFLIRLSTKSGHTSISATEWLNRHGILVPGQAVDVSDVLIPSAYSRKWVYGHYCAADSDAGALEHWDHVKSPHEPWNPIPEEPEIKLTVNGKEIKVSAETRKAIKEAL